MNYRERMEWLIGEVKRRIAVTHVRNVSSENVKLLEVTAGLLRCCVEQVDALESLLRNHKFEGAFVVQRAIWEYWKEFEFLMRRPNPADDAVRFEANTVFDILETLSALPDRDDDAAKTTNEWLARVEARYPELVAEVRERRAKKKGHWSGESRSKVFAPAGASGVTYRALSWQSHPELAVFREVLVELGQDGGTLRIVPEELDKEEVAERAAWGATGMLWYLWSEFAKRWELEPFDLPPARASV